MNLATPDILVISIAFAAAIVNAYFLRMGMRDGNRALSLSAAVAFLVFALVAVVFFWRAI